AVLNIPAGSTFSIDGAGNNGSFGWMLGGTTVNLAGQTFWNTFNAVVLGGTTTINNQPGAVITIQCDQVLTGGTLNNQGRIIKVVDFGPYAGLTTLATTLNNAGTLRVDAGTLNLAGTVVQVSGDTLVGGRWEVIQGASAGAALLMSSAGGISTIGPGASVTLDGPGTSFANLASLSVN